MDWSKMETIEELPSDVVLAARILAAGMVESAALFSDKYRISGEKLVLFRAVLEATKEEEEEEDDE